MVKGVTNAKVLGDETSGESVFFVDENKTEIIKGKRVLVDMGRYRVDDLFSCYVISASSSYCDWGSVFIDNDTVITFYKNAMTKFSYIDGKWVKNSISDFSVPQGGGFVLFPNGVVSMFGFNATLASAVQRGSILNKWSNRLMPSDITYLGRYREVDYAVSYYRGNIYTYDIVSNTCGEDLGILNNGICGGYLDEKNGKGFIVTTNCEIVFFGIEDDGNVIIESSIVVEETESMRIVGWTGCDVGDYLFFGTNYVKKYANNSSISEDVNSCLVVYKILEDDNGKRIVCMDSETLRYFQEVDCLVQYDNRNDVICIGTRDNVYAYKFNREEGCFDAIAINCELFVITSPYCYRLVLSPALDKAFVSVRKEQSVIECYMYDIGNAKRKIIRDDMVNYNNDTCFVGFLTGNTNSDGEVEVKVLLPEKVGVKFITNVDVEDGEICFEGVE